MQAFKSLSQLVIKVVVFFLFVLPVLQVHCAKICIFSVIGFMNYRSGYDNLLERLIGKGHELTVFSTLPLNVNKEYESKIKYVCPKSAVSHLDNFFDYVSPLEWRKNGKQHVLWDMLPILSLDICSFILQDEQTHKWIKEEKDYDLFIVDSAWNECGIALSYVFHAKLILFSWHSNLLTWNLEAFGVTSEIATVPDPQYSSIIPAEYNYPINFLRRFHFTIRSLRWHIYRNSFSFFQVRKFCVQFLGVKDEEFPGVGEIEQNASVVLVNSHPVEEYARSLPPVFVEVGGVHVRDQDKLGGSGRVLTKVKNFVGNSSMGVVLVNLGCSKDTVFNLPSDVKEGIIGAMRKSKESTRFVFIWPGKDKVGSQFSEKVSENVLVVEECTSVLNTILGHAQVKAFVTHGDLLDIQEAIYHGVPLILLPVAFEQDANAERIERLERGIRLEITTLKEDELKEAFNEVISNSIYKTNMRLASKLFKKRQVQPLDSTLWWIENTLRSSADADAITLKSLGIHENWFSRRSLDVWFFIFFCVISSITLLIIFMFNSMLSKPTLSKHENGNKN